MHIAERLSKQGISYVIAEKNHAIVAQLREVNIAAVVGDALNSTVLQQLNIVQARMLVIAIPNMFNVLKIAKTGRKFNSTIKIVIRTHSENNTHLQEKKIIDKIFFGENELANSMSQYILKEVENFNNGEKHEAKLLN